MGEHGEFFFDKFQLLYFSSLIFLSNKSTSDKTEKNKFSFIGGTILKNTYLVRVINSENKVHLEEISGREWRQIVVANK